MSFLGFTEIICLFQLPPHLWGGWNDIDIQGFSQISNTIWLKPICFFPSARPINGTAINIKIRHYIVYITYASKKWKCESRIPSLFLVLSSLCFAQTYDFTVAKDGSGNFKTIQTPSMPYPTWELTEHAFLLNRACTKVQVRRFRLPKPMYPS